MASCNSTSSRTVALTGAKVTCFFSPRQQKESLPQVANLGMRHSIAIAAACSCLGQSNSSNFFCRPSTKQQDEQYQQLVVNKITCLFERHKLVNHHNHLCAACNGRGIHKNSSKLSNKTSKLTEKISSHLNDKLTATPKELKKFLHLLKVPHEQILCAKVGTKQPLLQSSMATRKDSSPDRDNHLVANNNDDYSHIDKDTDSGYAWVILAVIFVINASTIGTARAYGLIFDKLAHEDEQSRSQAALPFTIMGAVENMAGLFSGYLLTRLGSWRVTVCAGSLLVAVAHLLAAILASQTGQLLAMGLMCGFGQSLVTISFFQVNNAYFVRYRSTAFGLGLTGSVFGTLYITPLCQYVLDNYGTSACYLMLGLILLPNVPLSLLLKPKRTNETSSQFNSNKPSTTAHTTLVENPVVNLNQGPPTIDINRPEIVTISGKLSQRDKQTRGIWTSIKLVICNPIFHLIWPTQLLFCWFNWVFTIFIVDFGKDRGLSNSYVAQLVPIWAFGQLVGRLVLGSLVDLKYITYKSFTVICFASIGLITWALNNVKADGDYLNLLVSVLVFMLSMFIALLYILFNGLVVNYVERSLQSLSIGISSFTGSFFLLPRASVIGYYRDTTGNYDAMLTMFTYTALIAATFWLVIPPVCRRLYRLWLDNMKRHTNKALENLQPYSSWILNSKSSSLRQIDFKKQEPRICPSLCLSHQYR